MTVHSNSVESEMGHECQDIFFFSGQLVQCLGGLQLLAIREYL